MSQMYVLFFSCFYEPVITRFASTTGHNRGYRPTRGLIYRGTPSALVPGDPSKPCRRCWDRYARSYEGPLVFADWEGNANGTGGTNYQRPISDPPPLPEASPLTPSPSPVHSRTPSGASPWRSNPVVTSAPATPFSAQYTRRGLRGTRLVPPGNPRIGRVCWNCDGTGEINLFIFGQDQCRICGGLGRIR